MNAKKIVCLLLSALPLCGMAQNQKMLSIEENTEGGIGVYPCGDRHEAMVQFEISEPFGLEFRSNYDQELNITVDSVAGKKTYSIVFVTQAPGVNYDGRRVTIMAEGFRNYVMTLNLRDKQKLVYTVSDPYSVLRSPYFVYQDKANGLFYNGEYQWAKDCYEMIRVCPEYASNKEYIDQRIALCDSMIVWQMQAQKLEQFAQYRDAADVYYKMYLQNSGNVNISNRINECRKAYADDCENEYVLAEHYMDLGQKELARASYQRLVDKRCASRMAEATTALANLQRHDAKEAQNARCVFYEVGKNMPIGLTYAQCYSENRRSSGYITLRTNFSALKAMTGTQSAKGSIEGTWPVYSTNSYYKEDLERSFENESLKFKYGKDYKQNKEDDRWHPKDLDFESAVSFGWTVRLWRYFFAHLGTGYHGGGFYTFDENDACDAIADWRKSHNNFDPSAKKFDSWDEELRHDCMEANWFHGVVGEGGLIVKVWHLNAKVTYQYTGWLNKGHYKDFLDDNKTRLYFGLGFNW